MSEFVYYVPIRDWNYDEYGIVDYDYGLGLLRSYKGLKQQST